MESSTRDCGLSHRKRLDRTTLAPESIFTIMLFTIATSRQMWSQVAKAAFASRECMVPLDASWAVSPRKETS
jgi:hypothetical protein